MSSSKVTTRVRHWVRIVRGVDSDFEETITQSDAKRLGRIAAQAVATLDRVLHVRKLSVAQGSWKRKLATIERMLP